MADVFRLTKALSGISLRPDGRGSLSTLPVGALLQFIGPSKAPGFVEITCCGTMYRIFRVDLIERTVAVRTLAAAA